MKKILFLLISILFSLSAVKGQEIIEIDPLFEYPVAPEEMESLTDRCDYIVKNFWNNFDFKRKEPVDQYALNSAFQVYASTIPYASVKEVEQSVSKLVEKISGNPVLLLQFTKAAEENFYGPRAEIWVDDLYLEFLEALIKNKKIPEARKTKYITQASALRGSKVGNVAPSFEFIDVNGTTKNYFPMSTPTLLIFGNPEDTDWRLARLKLESNLQLGDALDKGKINILYMVPYTIDNLKNVVSNYNKHWTIGQAEEISKIYDLKTIPTVYIISSEGKILRKNIPLFEAVDIVLDIIK